MEFHLCAWLLTIIYYFYGKDDCDDFYICLYHLHQMVESRNWLFLEIEDEIINNVYEYNRYDLKFPEGLKYGSMFWLMV